MLEPEPASRKKSGIWIWIVVALVVLCLCSLVVLIAVGAFASWKGYIHLPEISIPNVPGSTATPQPPQRITPPSAPTQASTEILIEPYQPQIIDQYPTLQNLVPNWESSSVPGTRTWNVELAADQSTLFFQGWCTTTSTILNENYNHIQYLAEVDGKSVSVESLYRLDSLSEEQACRDYIGLIRVWPAGQHIIMTTMRLNSQINDGWSDYPAGDYVEIYNVTVNP